MGATGKKQAKWFISLKSIVLKKALAIAIAILAVVFISIIAVQVVPDSSEATSRIEAIDSDSSEAISRIDAMESGFTKGTPQIEVIGISGSGESFIIVEGELAHEGDIINGFRILKIYPDRVEFEKNGKIVAGK